MTKVQQQRFDVLSDEQRLALAQAARVVSQDKGLNQLRAVEHCLEHPEDVAQLAAAFSGLAGALGEPVILARLDVEIPGVVTDRFVQELTA